MSSKDSVTAAILKRAELALSPRTPPTPEECRSYIAGMRRFKTLTRQTTQDGDHAHR